MVERLGEEVKAIGVLIGSDGVSAVLYKEHASGLITTIPQEGTIDGIGRLPEVKRTARRLARQFETTLFIPRRQTG